ncbi:MAG: dethiobiotin synthase [Myxococcota bacterium]
MMSGVFVTSTGTDIGKTYVACGILRESRRRGWRLVPRKPVVSGFEVEDWGSSDPGQLMGAAGLSKDDLQNVSPLRYRAPLAPEIAARLEGRSYTFQEVVQASRSSGPTLVEGVGGIMVPVEGTLTVLDWIEAVDLPVVMVVGSYLGTLSHTLTAWAVLRQKGPRPACIVIAESREPALSLEETREALMPFVDDAPIFLIPRGGTDFATLVDWCQDVGSRPTSK